jgi:IS30 family transposase
LLGNSSQAYPTELRRKSGEGKHHTALALRTGVVVYFADPRSPWQRGCNENTNGLLRQYLPKGTDLSVYSQDDLNQIALSLNTRLSQRYGFHMPLQVYNEHLRLAEGKLGTIH